MNFGAPPDALARSLHAVVAELVAWTPRHAPDRAFLGLFAAAGTDAFYRRHGFERHDEFEGMFQVVRRS